MMRRGEAFVLPVALLAGWEVGAAIGLLPAYVSRPSLVLLQLWELIRTGEIVQHIAVSLYRSLAGLVLATTAGVLLGLLSGVSPRVNAFIDPLVSLTNPVPKVAILPVLIVWFGITDTTKIVLIAIACFYPTYLAALAGVRQVHPVWVWAAQNMGARPSQVFFKVVLPAALPQIVSGVRISLALAFILMFASEAVGTAHRAGLGFLIILAEAGGRFDLMLAAIVVIAFLGFFADRALGMLSRSVLGGRRSFRA